MVSFRVRLHRFQTLNPFFKLPHFGLIWRHILGGACLSGIGFTMALFIDSLALTDSILISLAKIGILSASIVSGILGRGILRKIELKGDIN